MMESAHNTGSGPGPSDATRDPNAPVTITAGILGALLVALIIILLQAAYFRALDREHQIKVVAETPQELQDLRTAQMEKLEGYKWVDRKNGVVSIPIDRAMELVVRDAKARRP